MVYPTWLRVEVTLRFCLETATALLVPLPVMELASASRGLVILITIEMPMWSLAVIFPRSESHLAQEMALFVHPSRIPEATGDSTRRISTAMVTLTSSTGRRFRLYEDSAMGPLPRECRSRDLTRAFSLRRISMATASLIFWLLPCYVTTLAFTRFWVTAMGPFRRLSSLEFPCATPR